MAGTMFRGIEMPPEMEGGIKEAPPFARPGPAPGLDIIGYAGKAGSEFYGLTVVGFRQSSGLDGRWEARVYHPTNGIEVWTERANRMSSLTPVRVVLREQYDVDTKALREIIEAISARMVALEAQVKALAEIVAGSDEL